MAALADTADTSNFINEKTGRWRKIDSAPKDGTVIDLWLSIHASPLSMGMSDEFGVPDAWWDGSRWVHTYRGRPTELYGHYVTHWRAHPTHRKP